jgi:hypothetical protein
MGEHPVIGRVRRTRTIITQYFLLKKNSPFYGKFIVTNQGERGTNGNSPQMEVP